MLFNVRINEIQSQVSSNAIEIDALLLRVEQLRNENLALESHLQQLGSAESAAESAIEQIKTALMMIESISPAEVATFKGAIDGLFEKEFPLLPQFVDADVVEDTPPATDGGDSDAIMVDAQEDGDSDAIMVEAQEDGISGGEFPTVSDDSNGHNDNGFDLQDLADLFNTYSVNDLRKLAKSRKLTGSGNRLDLIRRLRADGITPDDLQQGSSVS